MKKKLLFIILSSFYLSTFSQVTYINETFDATTLPAGWTSNDLLANGDAWSFNNPGSRTINAPVSGGFAIFDSDNTSDNSLAEDIALETPAFDASGQNSVILIFDHYYDDNSGDSNDTYIVEVFDGTSWVAVQSGTGSDTTNATQVFIDISAQASGVANAQVRFRYQGTWDWYWAIDNVKIYSSPNNDDCINAENLVVGRVFNDNVAIGKDLYSTVSGETPSPSCGTFGVGYDLWYKVTVPAGGNLAIETRNQDGTVVDDTVMIAYTGTCGSFTELICDTNSGEGNYSRIMLTGRTAGEVLYIRLFEEGNDVIMDFTISAFTCYQDRLYWDGTNWTFIKDDTISATPPDIDTESMIYLGGYDTAINGSFSTCSCEVLSGNTLTIKANDYVEIDKELINDGNIVIENNGSLVQNDTNATISGIGTYSMQRISTPLNDIHDYTYWSSPVTSHTLGDMITTTYYYDFNATTQYWNQRGAAANMDAGVGYIAKATSGTISGSTDTVTFTGAPFNTGTISTNMQFTTVNGVAADDSWNLIGNPYPSGIDADALIAHNATMNGTLYFWSHITPLNPSGTSYASSDYATWNNTGSVGTAATSAVTGNGNTNAPTGIIAAGQAFFAQANTTGNIEFTNAMRVTTGNNNFYRTANSNSDRIWLNLTNAQEAFKQQLIGFLPDATDGFDRLYDGYVNNGNGYINFYSINNNEKFVILANDLIDTEDIIPLGYESSIATTFEISIDHLSGALDTDEFDIYIKDLNLNIVHNLKEGSYNFTTEIGTFDNRFELFIQRSSALAVNETVLTDDKLILFEDTSGTFNVSTVNHKEIETVTVYNVLGQKIIINNESSETIMINLRSLPKGNLFIFDVKSIDGQHYTKKIIKK